MKTHTRLIGGVCLLLVTLKVCCFAAPAPKPLPKERTALKGHENMVLAVAFSPDGKVLASASADKTIKLWDVAKATCLHTLSGHSHYVTTIAFTPDGKYLASAGYDHELRLWEVGTGKEIALLSRRMGFRNLAVSPDSKSLVVVDSRNCACLWDISSRRLVKKFDMNLAEGARIIPHSMAYGAEGKLLSAVWPRSTRTTEIWDVAAGKSIRTLQYPEQGDFQGCVAFSPDGKRLVSALSRICLWDIRAGKCLGDYAFMNDSKHLGGRITCLAFNPDGKLLAVGWQRNPPRPAHMEGVISILDPATGKELATLEGHTQPLDCLVFSPDGKVLASASADRSIKLWDVRGVQTP